MQNLEERIQYGLLCEQQRIRGNWRAYGFIAPEGQGKSYAIAAELTRMILCTDERRLSIIAATRSFLGKAHEAMRNAAPLWARPQGLRITSLDYPYPYERDITMCSLDASPPPEPETHGVVWLVDLGAWPEEHADTFERVRNADVQILWDATSDTSLMVQSLDESTPGHRVVRDLPPPPRKPGFAPQGRVL